MKKIICMALVLVLLLLSTVAFVSCTDDECMICGGSGYYQKKDCPGC